MTERETAKKIEKIIIEYLLSSGAWVDEFCIYIADDNYGVEERADEETTAIAIDRLAEHIAKELQ